MRFPVMIIYRDKIFKFYMVTKIINKDTQNVILILLDYLQVGSIEKMKIQIMSKPSLMNLLEL